MRYNNIVFDFKDGFPIYSDFFLKNRTIFQSPLFKAQFCKNIERSIAVKFLKNLDRCERYDKMRCLNEKNVDYGYGDIHHFFRNFKTNLRKMGLSIPNVDEIRFIPNILARPEKNICLHILIKKSAFTYIFMRHISNITDKQHVQIPPNFKSLSAYKMNIPKSLKNDQFLKLSLSKKYDIIPSKKVYLTLDKISCVGQLYALNSNDCRTIRIFITK